MSLQTRPLNTVCKVPCDETTTQKTAVCQPGNSHKLVLCWQALCFSTGCWGEKLAHSFTCMGWPLDLNSWGQCTSWSSIHEVFRNVFDSELLQNNRKSNIYVIWLVFRLHQSINLCDILLDIFKSLQLKTILPDLEKLIVRIRWLWDWFGTISFAMEVAANVTRDYNMTVWHFGPCVTFWPCLCEISARLVWHFGPLVRNEGKRVSPYPHIKHWRLL